MSVACAKPPPAKPVVRELDVTGTASFAGAWVADGAVDFYYALAIEPDGKLLMTIDRGKMGRCEQKGRLEPAGDPRSYRLVLEKNTCNPELGGGPFELAVSSFTGDHVTLGTGPDGAMERRTYARDPKVQVP